MSNYYSDFYLFTNFMLFGKPYICQPLSHESRGKSHVKNCIHKELLRIYFLRMHIYFPFFSVETLDGTWTS